MTTPSPGPSLLYCPDRGDFVWLDFDPIRGHEQRGRRPALVLTRRVFNERGGLCLACPVTSTDLGFSFDVKLPQGLQVKGVIRAHHLRSLSWTERQCEFLSKCPHEVFSEVLARVKALLE